MDGHLKIAIPRLERREPKQKAPDKHRVVKACNSCRKRKVKCSGEFPRCSNCVDSISTCIYPQARKDRLREATEQNTHLIALLKDLKLRVDDGDRRKIDDLLEEKNNYNTATSPTQATSPTLGKRLRDENNLPEIDTGTPGEAKVSGSVGSNEDSELLNEDLLRSPKSRATGFHGQNSEVQWLRSLKANMGGPAPDNEGHELPYGPPGTGEEAARKRIDAQRLRMDAFKLNKMSNVNESSFYLDAEDLDVDEFLVEPYHLPPNGTAKALFNCYMDTVHSSFPIMPNLFQKNFEHYLQLARTSQPVLLIDKFQAILNLIFAIGAKYSHLTKTEWAGDEGDHHLYMTRAIRLLGLNNSLNVIDAPDLGLIQATGLLSFYYLTIGHVSRAWVMIGISIRFALAVGLHLRNENPSVAPARKELLVQTWWALQSVECLLSAITGRPCVISNEFCTVPLPHIFQGDEPIQSPASSGFSQPSRGPFSARSLTPGSQTSVSSPLSYLRSHIRIGIITQEALAKLYSPPTATKSWDSIQRVIISLYKSLEDWALSTTPRSIPSLSYESIHNKDFNPVSRSMQREQLLLAMSYQSLKLQITKPCLCRMENRIQEQSKASTEFNTRTATTCVQAAEDMTKLLPDEPAGGYIYEQGPWWCIVHYIMQAVAVFLLKITYPGGYTSPKSRTDILRCIKKLLKWLNFLTPENPVAARAVKVVLDILKHAPERLQADFADILADDIKAPTGNFEDHTQDRFYDWNSEFQSRCNSTTLSDLRMVSQISNLGSFGSGSEVVESVYNANTAGMTSSAPGMSVSEENSPDSAYQWWLGDLGFQFPPTYNNPFQTTFDQSNPPSPNMDDSYGTYTTESL